MISLFHRYCLLWFLLILLLIPGIAQAISIDFESLSDFESVTTQFAGLTFTHTLALTAGVSLNELEFPPTSGINIVSDDNGPIIIDFSTPQSTISGFFTYTALLTLTAFDLTNTIVAMKTSSFASNLALSGDLGSSPNEFLSVTFFNGISRVVIAGDPAGGSFALDDLTVTSVPEPSTLIYLVSGFAILFGGKNLCRFIIGRPL